jgi:starch synthase
MDVLHISAECYPAAKTGGLADVVGALPKYLINQGVSAGAVIPKYDLPWMRKQQFAPVFQGTVRLHNEYVPFTIEREQQGTLGFPFFVVDIPGKFDRPGIYADPQGRYFPDEVERYLCFQQAVLQWLMQSSSTPSILHCHDHHTGLIPFMIKHCPEYRSLSHLPTIFTIHNGEYHGSYGWDKFYLLPFSDEGARGLLDWNEVINPLATGIKTAWRVTTVSQGYLAELMESAGGLEYLIRHEQHKCLGITNGIDTQVWDPATDPYLSHNLTSDDWVDFKIRNQSALAARYNLDWRYGVITFIGRLVNEKGADLLPDLIRRSLREGLGLAFAMLGTGEPWLHERLGQLEREFPGRVSVVLAYDEGLAHQLYAGSDFLIMPSRVEPCGLNQMYAMRYGTIPIVRAVGGLRDTVPDIGEPDGSGRGIQFTRFTLEDGYLALYRADQLYQDKDQFAAVRQRVTAVDFSWERAAREYITIYRELQAAAQ